MLTIFRKIRQRMLIESRFTRYMVYAVGEIILVVVGILIALSINNWNSAKKDKAFEVKMLNEINKALKADLIFFNDHLIGNRNRSELNAVAFFDRAMINNRISEDSIDYHFYRLHYGLRPTCNRGSYDALKASGIDKLTSDTLRNKLVYYYDFIIPRYQGIIEVTLTSSYAEMNPLIKNLTEPSVPTIGDDGRVVRGIKLKDFDIASNKELNELIYISKERAEDIKFMLEEMTPYMKELSGLIEKEI